jgi:hypothetical protein
MIQVDKYLNKHNADADEDGSPLCKQTQRDARLLMPGI